MRPFPLNPFSSRAGKLRRSRVRTTVELAKARYALAEARSTYRAGGYSGHPENQLELIENRQYHLDRIARLIEEGRTPDWSAIDAANQELNDALAQRPKVPYRELPQSYFDRVDAADQRIREAWRTNLG